VTTRALRNRVLIVEDEPTIRELLDDFLTGEGFETRVTSDGRSALEIAERDQPDLILMDVMLPVLDGATATRLLKECDATRGIRVVAMSANCAVLDDRRVLPADDVIRKPFDLETLLTQIRRQLAMPLGALLL
jgi:CheY-like chemotaxis protein